MCNPLATEATHWVTVKYRTCDRHVVWFMLVWTQKSLALPRICPPTRPALPSLVLGAVQGCTWLFASWQLLDAQGTISTCTWTPPTTGHGQNKVPKSINHRYHTLPGVLWDHKFYSSNWKADFLWKGLLVLLFSKIFFTVKILTLKHILHIVRNGNNWV